MNRRQPHIPWLKHLWAIEKHLEKNEKWFQYPERKITTFEKEIGEWNQSFLTDIGKIEEMIKELEKRMEH